MTLKKSKKAMNSMHDKMVDTPVGQVAIVGDPIRSNTIYQDRDEGD